jgi:galactose mutarotase-like enzyme
LPQHGFARDLKFNVTAQGSNTLEYTLESNANTQSVFPFSFQFKILYILSNHTLTTRFTTVNTGNSQMLYSFGAHPAFNCPMLPGTCLDDYAIKFYNTNLVHTLLAEGLRTSIQKPVCLQNGALPLHPTLFDNDALVFENNQITAVSLLFGQYPLLTLNCKNWPYFGIWSKSAAPFICFEPWHGVADHIATDTQWALKPGLIPLQPNSTYSAEFTLDFQGITQYKE